MTLVLDMNYNLILYSGVTRVSKQCTQVTHEIWIVWFKYLKCHEISENAQSWKSHKIWIPSSIFSLHPGFPAGPFWGGDSPPPKKKNQLLPPPNFYWLYFLPLGALGYSPPPKVLQLPPKRWNPAGNPDIGHPFTSFRHFQSVIRSL